ncbi:MAG: FAD-binding oxidoreductase, partial [Verrucomicrobiota bacterium]
MRRKIWKRIAWASALLVLLFLIVAAHPAFHILKTIWHDRNETVPSPPGTVNDASHLDQTTVSKIWPVPNDPALAETQLAGLLQFARTNHLKVSIAGARHSMGGQAVFPGCLYLDMTAMNKVRVDKKAGTVTVGAGTMWHQLQHQLDAMGLAVDVMQTPNVFTVGGALSVNAHGSNPASGPMSSTVKSMRVALPDGQVVTCSPTENADVWSRVIGGYGMFGVILEATLTTRKNERLKPHHWVMDYAAYPRFFAGELRND